MFRNLERFPIRWNHLIDQNSLKTRNRRAFANPIRSANDLERIPKDGQRCSDKNLLRNKKLERLPVLSRSKNILYSYAFVLLALGLSTTTANAMSCRVTYEREGALAMDKMWSGTPVGYAAIQRNGKVYFAYYNPERKLTVSELNIQTKQLCTISLNSIFKGWDSHNRIAMTFDNAGFLHVSGNMHGNSLVYARSDKPDSIQGMRLQPMIGRDENRVTYPQFLSSPDGRLFFRYRQGGSGNGKWFVNALKDGAWMRVLDKPVFGNMWRGDTVNAYPPNLYFDRTGYVRVPVVWRKTPDVATNFALTYAQTRDFENWETADGKPLQTPLTPDNSEMIDFTDENRGLVNAVKIALNNKDQPVIVYRKYGPAGRNALYLAIHTEKGWVSKLLNEWNRLSPVKGVGSINLGRFATFMPESGLLVASYPGVAIREYRFDPETFEPTAPPRRTSTNRSSQPQKWPELVTIPEGTEDARLLQVSVRNSAVPGERAGVIQYFAQAMHNDRPRQCTPKAPLACNPPPSETYFIPAP